MKRKKDHIGNKSQYSWDKAVCIAELNSTSPNTKLNYSSLAKKFNLLNNKDIYDLQYEGCLFTQRYYNEDINSHLLITLYISHPLKRTKRSPHIFCVITTHPNFMKLLLVFYNNSRLAFRRFRKNLF